MPIVPDELLSTTRGRRLLLEFALLSESRREHAEFATELPLWKAVFDTQVASPDAVDPRGWGADHIPRASDPHTIARLLDKVVLVRVTPAVLEELQAALQRPAGAAGSREIDALLASAGVERALARIARHLLHKRQGSAVRVLLRALADGEGPGGKLSGGGPEGDESGQVRAQR